MNTNEAIEYWTNRINQQPTCEAYHCLSSLYKSLNQIEYAKSLLEYGLNLNSYDLNAKNDYGVLLMETNDIDLAINEFKQIIIINRNHIKARTNLSVCYAKKGELSKSLIHARKAYTLSPNDPLILRNLAQVLELMGHIEESNQIRKKSLIYFHQFTPNEHLLLYKYNEINIKINNKINNNKEYDEDLIQLNTVKEELKQYNIENIDNILNDVDYYNYLYNGIETWKTLAIKNIINNNLKLNNNNNNNNIEDINNDNIEDNIEENNDNIEDNNEIKDDNNNNIIDYFNQYRYYKGKNYIMRHSERTRELINISEGKVFK